MVIASTIGFAGYWDEEAAAPQQQPQPYQHPPHSLLEIISRYRRSPTPPPASGASAGSTTTSRPIPIPVPPAAQHRQQQQHSSLGASPSLSPSPSPSPSSLRNASIVAAPGVSSPIPIPSYITGAKRKRKPTVGSAGSTAAAVGATQTTVLPSPRLSQYPQQQQQQQQPLTPSPLALALGSTPPFSSSPATTPTASAVTGDAAVPDARSIPHGASSSLGPSEEGQQQHRSGGAAQQHQQAGGEYDPDGSIAAARAEERARRAQQRLRELQQAQAAEAALSEAERAAAKREQEELDEALAQIRVAEITEKAMRLADERPELRVPFESFRRKVTSSGRLELTQEDLTDPHRWQALGPFLAACPEIRALRLQGMEIGKEEATALSNGVLKQIRHVTFCGNSIGATSGCLEILVSLLLLCEYLESAAILHNSITDKQIEPVLKLLREHQKLTSLDLCWNGLGDASAAQLSRALRLLQHSLSKLDLSYNCLSPEGQRTLREVQEELRHAGRPIDIITVGNRPFSKPASLSEPSNTGSSSGPSLLSKLLAQQQQGESGQQAWRRARPLQQHNSYVRSIGLRGQLFGVHTPSPLLRHTRTVRFQRHSGSDNCEGLATDASPDPRGTFP